MKGQRAMKRARKKKQNKKPVLGLSLQRCTQVSRHVDERARDAPSGLWFVVSAMRPAAGFEAA